MPVHPIHSKATKKTIGELNLPKDATIGGIIRNDEGLIAFPAFQIEANDKVVIFALPNAIEKTLDYFN